jgi:hypothetical protein
MISHSELERFYSAKKINGACSSCGGNKWEFGAPPDDATQWALSSVRTDGNAVMPAPSVPTLVLICANCFTLRTHAFLAIQNWVTANPAREDAAR